MNNNLVKDLLTEFYKGLLIPIEEESDEDTMRFRDVHGNKLVVMAKFYKLKTEKVLVMSADLDEAWVHIAPESLRGIIEVPKGHRVVFNDKMSNFIGWLIAQYTSTTEIVLDI